MVQAIEKAIMKSDLGLTPITRRHGDPRAAAAADRGAPPGPHQGGAARSRERARRRAQRAPRRDARRSRKCSRRKLISQDDEQKAEDDIQKLTDKYVADIDAAARGQGKGADAGLSHRRCMCQSPRHIAIIMDGNGRWAAARGLPRHAGHKQGVRPVRMCVEDCARRGIEALTLFAFSSENWQRPTIEVAQPDAAVPGRARPRSRRAARERRAAALHRRPAGAERRGCRRAWRASEALTAGNTGLKLQVAVELRRALGHRAGRARALRGAWPSGALRAEDIDEDAVRASSWRSPTSPIRTCSSAPAASSASAISCCGISRTPSCISATRCGRISTCAQFDAALDVFAGTRAPLRPDGASRSREAARSAQAARPHRAWCWSPSLLGVMLWPAADGHRLAAHRAGARRRVGVGGISRGFTQPAAACDVHDRRALRADRCRLCGIPRRPAHSWASR